MVPCRIQRRSRDAPSLDGHELSLRSNQIRANKDLVQLVGQTWMRRSLAVDSELSKRRKGGERTWTDQGQSDLPAYIRRFLWPVFGGIPDQDTCRFLCYQARCKSRMRRKCARCRREYRVLVNDAQVLGCKIGRRKDNQNRVRTETRGSPSGGIKQLVNAREQVLTPPEKVSQKW